MILLPLSLFVMELVYVDLIKARIKTDFITLMEGILSNIEARAFSNGNIDLLVDINKWITKQVLQKYPQCTINQFYTQSEKGEWYMVLEINIPYLTLNKWFDFGEFYHNVELSRKVVLPWHH